MLSKLEELKNTLALLFETQQMIPRSKNDDVITAPQLREMLFSKLTAIMSDEAEIRRLVSQLTSQPNVDELYIMLNHDNVCPLCEGPRIPETQRRGLCDRCATERGL